VYTEILLDKPRRLRFDLSAIRWLENQTGGRPLGQIINDLRQMGFSVLMLALIAGLKHEDSTLSVNLMSKIVEQYLRDGGTLDVVFRDVIKAFDDSGLFRTEEDKVPEGNAQPEQVA
jgi:hypothetical protein